MALVRAPYWAVILLLVSTTLFTSLGFWQLARAKEKAQLLAAAAKYEPKAFKSGDKPKPYQAIKLVGNIDNRHTLLLDNQFYRHQVGFRVLSPLKLASGKYILVDRGWVKARARRDSLPKIAAVKHKRELLGVAYYPSDKAWVLNSRLEGLGRWPLIIEKIELKRLATLLNVSFYPFVLRLKTPLDKAYIREWPVVTMSPAKHKGYAFQWFSFAVAALIIFFRVNRRSQ